MAITDYTRKLLWARSGNQCALCRRQLVEPGNELDRDAVVGDECHILPHSPRGPRATTASRKDIDGYENLILLCKADHKLVDDQPEKYSAQTLREIRNAHEFRVKLKLQAHDSASFPDIFATVSGDTTVPALPDYAVVRSDILLSVKQLLFSKSSATIVAVAGVTGAGGFGKTVAATFISRDPDVHEYFTDGVYWIVAGAERSRYQSTRAEYLSELCTILSGFQVTVSSLERARQIVRGCLRNRVCLIVLDDVWDSGLLEVFSGVSSQSRVLVTTRRQDLVDPLNTVLCEQMSARDSTKLLAARFDATTSEELALLSRIAERLGYWPILLAIVGAALRRRYDATSNLDLAISEVLAKLDVHGPSSFDPRFGERTASVTRTLDYSLDTLDGIARAST